MLQVRVMYGLPEMGVLLGDVGFLRQEVGEHALVVLLLCEWCSVDARELIVRIDSWLACWSRVRNWPARWCGVRKCSWTARGSWCSWTAR